MPAWYRQRGPRSFEVRIRSGSGKPKSKNVKSEKDARDLVRIIEEQERRGVDVGAAIERRQGRVSRWPRLRDALPEFIATMTARGDWTGSTPINYRRRLASHVYDFPLSDGGTLGDLPVDHITGPLLGAVLDTLRARTADGRAGKSLGLQHQIRSPLVAYFREQIIKNGFPGPNPAADLRAYMSKNPTKRARQGRTVIFQHQEAPALFRTCEERYPRWLAFIGLGMLAGLRWGEMAALEIAAIDWRRKVVHVRRSFCEKTGAVKDVKDHEDRYVPLDALSPRLLTWLREHVERTRLEGQVAQWTAAQRTLLFPNSRGNIGRHSVFMEHVWQPLLTAAGLSYRKPHAMRHTFGTWCAEGDPGRGITAVPIHQLKTWMGHASVEETERYLHADAARAGRSVDILEGLLP